MCGMSATATRFSLQRTRIRKTTKRNRRTIHWRGSETPSSRNRDREKAIRRRSSSSSSSLSSSRWTSQTDVSVSAASMPAASSDEKNDNVKKNEMEVMPPAVKYPPHLGIGTNAAFVVSVFASIAVPFALCITRRLPVSIGIAVTSIAAVTLAVLRIIVVDVAYAATLWDYNDPRLVPEPDSRFVEVGGADVHIQSVGRDDIASRTASGTGSGT